jgi:Tripartite tricarboxylate transporter TctB family
MAQQTTDEARAPSWIRTNQGVAVCIAAVAVALLVYLAQSEWAFRLLRDGFHLGFFTAVAVVAMLVCALAMIVDGYRHDVEDDMAVVRWQDWVLAIGAMALCYLYFALAWQFGFLLVTPIFMAAATYALGARPASTAVLSGLAMTAIIYGLFWLIRIELPASFFGF